MSGPASSDRARSGRRARRSNPARSSGGRRRPPVQPAPPTTLKAAPGTSSTSTTLCHSPAPTLPRMPGRPWARKASSVGRWLKAKICALLVSSRLSAIWPGSGVPKTATFRSHHGTATAAAMSATARPRRKSEPQPICIRQPTKRNATAQEDRFHAREVGEAGQHAQRNDRPRSCPASRPAYEARGRGEYGEGQRRVGHGGGHHERRRSARPPGRLRVPRCGRDRQAVQAAARRHGR